jgi:putative ABC transport system permease protein
MSSLFRGEFTVAVRMLQRNKVRSILTMVGIIVGVAAVVTIVGIGKGMEDQISQQAVHLGKDLITIRPGSESGGVTANDIFGGGDTARAGASLGDDDLRVVQATSGVAAVSALHVVTGSVMSGGSTRKHAIPVIASDGNLPTLLNQSLAYGSFIDVTDAAINKVVLGSHATAELFDQNVPLGQTVTILGHEFIVTGILTDFQTMPLSGDFDFNNAIFISNEQASLITNNHAPLYEMLVRPTNTHVTDGVVTRLNQALQQAHGGQHDFTVFKQGQAVAAAQSILGLFTVVVTGMAVLCLLVSGVGIMNVMLVSVTERMHEIGIRKAVGATNRQILLQFIIEAGVLSFMGAVIGVIVAFIIEIVLRIFTNLTPIITWQVALVACVVSVLIGCLFGTAPALKAARKDPISALRNM